jgi:hypothetical protein
MKSGRVKVDQQRKQRRLSCRTLGGFRSEITSKKGFSALSIENRSFKGRFDKFEDARESSEYNYKK